MTENSPYIVPCPNCALKISKDAQACSHCGADLSKKRKEKRKVSPTVAIILAFLFGPFGYLYLKKYRLFGAFLVGQIIIIYLVGFLIGPETSGIAGMIIGLFYIYHQYTLAKKINQEAEGKSKF